ADYFDLSFQHASESLLRRMRRFGSRESFLGLLDQIRALAPRAGVRSNVILGFPGETKDDVVELERFLTEARLDAIGVFGYSDEDGTEAATHAGKLDPGTITERVNRIGVLAEELTSQRADERVGELVDVLIEAVADRAGPENDTENCTVGRAGHQAPEVDGVCILSEDGFALGDLVRCRVVATAGVDLMVEPVEVLVPAGGAA
ncbi:MAG: 30S ribosomal protein S12 methylthiotransferase RimO, partial [Actinomycetota bacterium]|nr:30S ribosomal protein S12 methylthiotransferase RimO [Actinomycetota bacterium]